MMQGALAGLLGYVVIGAAAGSVGWFAAHNVGYASAMKEHRSERRVWLAREVTLWHELGAERQGKRELIDEVEQIINASGRARSDMLRELDSQKARLVAQEEEARAAIKRLELVEHTWKDERVPDAIVCVFNTTDCPGPNSAGAGGGDSLDLREPAAAGDDGTAGLPAVANGNDK